MRFLFSYLMLEYKKRIYFSFRQLFLLSFIIASIFFFAAFWPSVNFDYTATYQNAKYDVQINGPIKFSDLKNILKTIQEFNPEFIGFYTGSVRKLLIDNKNYLGTEALHFDLSDVKKLWLSNFSNGMLLKGKMSKPKGWGIDYITAKRIDADIGDRIGFEQVFTDEQGKPKPLKRWGFVSAIYAPANGTKGLLVPLSMKAAKLFKEGGVIYTDIFINSDITSPNELTFSISRIPESKNWTIQQLPIVYENSKTYFEQMINRNIRNATVWMSMLIYLIYILREQFLRIDRRKKNLAILFSLGFSRIRIYKLFITEQLILNLSTAAIGFWLGKYILEDTYGVFIPKETTYFLAGLFVIINVVVLILTIFQLIYRFNRLDVAKLLTSE